MNANVPNENDHEQRRRDIALIGARFGRDVSHVIEGLGVAGTRVAAELAWSDEDEGQAAANEIRVSERLRFATLVAEEMMRQGELASATTVA